MYQSRNTEFFDNPSYKETRVPNFQQEVNSGKYTDIFDALNQTESKEQSVYVLERNNDKQSGFEYAWYQKSLSERITLLTSKRHEWRNFTDENAKIINHVLKKDLQQFANHNLCHATLRTALNQLINYDSDANYGAHTDHTAALAQTYLTLFDRDYANPANNATLMANHALDLKQLKNELPGASNMGIGLLGGFLLAASVTLLLVSGYGAFCFSVASTSWVLSLLTLIDIAPFAVAGSGFLFSKCFDSSVASPTQVVLEAVEKHPTIIDDVNLTQIATQGKSGKDAKPTQGDDLHYETMRASMESLSR